MWVVFFRENVAGAGRGQVGVPVQCVMNPESGT